MTIQDAARTKAIKAAEKRLATYVEAARGLATFGKDLDFDATVWDLTGALGPIQGHARNLRFTKWGKGHHNEWDEPLSEPVAMFSRAYVRRRWNEKATGALDAQLRALRALDEVVVGRGLTSIALVDGETLAAALRVLETRFKLAPAYTAARELEQLAKALNKNLLTVVPIRFKSWLGKPAIDSARIGAEFDQQRMAKLPSPEALHAIGTIFGLATEPGDRVVSDILAILASAPDRIGEALCCPEDCEVEEEYDGRLVHGLRWLNKKGAPPTVKWTLKEMEPVVREAVGRLKSMSERGRRIAAWYEAHPTSLYLDPEHEHLRHQEWLSREEATAIIWRGPVARTVLNMMLDQNGIPKEKVKNEESGRWVLRVRFSDIERFVVSKLPPGFPILDANYNLKFSDSMCVFPTDFLHGNKTEWRCMVTRLTHSQVNARIAFDPKARARTIFEKFGFREADGSPIYFHTHMLRHYLNTMAQDAGLSQLDIALISGRKVVAQNASYDHVSAERRLQKVRDTGPEAFEVRTGTEVPVRHKPISFGDVGKFRKIAFHMTEVGACAHQFELAPCKMHRDCLNCNEMYCTKGDEIRCDRIRAMRDQTRIALDSAIRADSQGEFGASRWVVHQKMTLERLDKLVLLFDDPAVPVGAIIHVASGAWSLSPPRRALPSEKKSPLLGGSS
jgi:hypothetical protein